MQEFIVCLVDGFLVEGFYDFEEYEIERELKKNSFTRGGKLPNIKCRRLLLPNNIFKLKMKEYYSFKIMSEPFSRFLQVTNFRDVSSHVQSDKVEMLSAEILWVIELI